MWTVEWKENVKENGVSAVIAKMEVLLSEESVLVRNYDIQGGPK